MVADGRRGKMTDSSAELSEDLVRFSTAVIGALGDEARQTPASNSYSHQRLADRQNKAPLRAVPDAT
jgi:hypothetical protein